MREIRVDPAEYRALPLRVHDFLADVPLHDVWRIRLRGGEADVTMSEVLARLVTVDTAALGPTTRLLFAIRRKLGTWLRWDVEPSDSRSAIHQLSSTDRRRSVDEPGTRRGFWKCVYTFDREALGEVINNTVHAFLLFALEPATDGYTVFWGIYVKPVNRLTGLYMAIIDPFRRRVVYPSIIRRWEQAWCEAASPSGLSDRFRQ